MRSGMSPSFETRPTGPREARPDDKLRRRSSSVERNCAHAGMRVIFRSCSARGSGPVFAAAERAAHAAFDLQRVRTQDRNVAGIAVAVIGVVNWTRPFVRAVGPHAAE